MFIGRQRELGVLNERYESKNFEFFCIYGRRRVGKTELIKEFIKDKKAVFFTGLDDTKTENLAALSLAVHESLFNVRSKAVYENYNDLFSVIYEYAQKEQLVLIIDEYPYLAKNYPGISSLFQVEIDHRLKYTNIFIILCGSSMSFMEKQVMGHKSPLYGRRTGQIKLFPFDYETSKLFFDSVTEAEKAVLFGITGGVAKYLQIFSNSSEVEKNIEKNFFSSEGLLFEEPVNLLNQEFRKPALYNSILTAIALGSSKVNEIVTKTGLSSDVCVKYLNNLVELSIVKKEIPVFDKITSKKGIYRLSDGMFRFWFRFVYKNISKIHLGQGDLVYSDIKNQIPDFMGEVFEQICIEYLWKAKLPISVSKIGRWWGNNPVRKAQQEIDIIAVNNDGTEAIFCECKWRNEKTSESLINELIEKAAMFTHSKKYYYIFSLSGYTESALKKSSESIRLIEFEDMFED